MYIDIFSKKTLWSEETIKNYTWSQYLNRWTDKLNVITHLALSLQRYWDHITFFNRCCRFRIVKNVHKNVHKNLCGSYPLTCYCCAGHVRIFNTPAISPSDHKLAKGQNFVDLWDFCMKNCKISILSTPLNMAIVWTFFTWKQ